MTASAVSSFQNASDTIPRDLDVSVVLKAIRTGGKKLQGQIAQIRNRFQAELAITGDYKKAKLAVDPLKKQLPGVTWTGTFSGRASDKLIQHSGLLVADLDSLGEKLADIRKKLLNSPHLWALFVSPSGDGLKAVHRVSADAQEHPASWRAVQKHVLELTGVQIDQSGKDPARLCFLSFDPDLYHNANATEIEPEAEPEKPKPRVFSPNGLVDLNGRQRIAAGLLGDIDWQSDVQGLCICPAIEKHTTSNGKRDCHIYLDDKHGPTIHCVHNSCRRVIETYNYRLRSLIGKVEYAESSARASTKLTCTLGESGNCGDGDVRSTPENEAVEAPAPYQPPPLDLLPSELQDYVIGGSESLNVDVAYILLPLLSAVGSAIGNSRSIFLKRGFIQPPVIWTGIIGRSGARKSPALESACFAVMQHERELARQNRDALTAYDEEMAAWEGRRKAERGAKPEPPTSLTCLMDDMTLEALADAMQTNPRGLLVKKDELSHWFAAFDQYHAAKGADVGRWLSLHTGVFFGLDRRTDHRRYRIHQPRVCITGGIQPQVLRRVLTEDFFERGLPARFLFAAPPSQKDKWSDTVISDSLRENTRELFGALWLLQPGREDKGEQCPELLRLDADAKAEFVRYYNECGDAALEGDEREEAAWSKLSGYAARLALVGQVARDQESEKITGEVMAAACELARWFGAEAVRIYASLVETREQREQRKLIEFIKSRGSMVSVRDVTHYYWPLKNQTEKAEQDLTRLVKAGLGKWEEVRPEGRGRPTRKFQLLPTSPSPKIVSTRGETGNYGDGDVPSGQKNETGWKNDPIIIEAINMFNATVKEPNGIRTV